MDTLWYMSRVRVHPSFPWLTLIDLSAAVPGMERFLCAYAIRGDKTALVDVGATSCIPDLLAGLGPLHIRPEEVTWIVSTHIHLDHGGGAGTALGYLPNARVLVHPSALSHMQDPTRLWQASVRTLGGPTAEAYGQPLPVPADRMAPAADGMSLDLGGLELQVLLTPGHAPHHFSLFNHRDGVLLAGELAGVRARGVRRPAVPPPFYLDQQLSSLDRAISLKPSIVCYGHYGWESNGTSHLRGQRRQLLSWLDTVEKGLHAGRSQEEIAQELVRSDPGLAALQKLTPLQRQRDMVFVLNSVAGLAGYLGRAATGE